MLALHVPSDGCRAFAMRQNWDESARQFLANIEAASLGVHRAPQADVTSGGEPSSLAA
jgi:hypothetical protein